MNQTDDLAVFMFSAEMKSKNGIQLYESQAYRDAVNAGRVTNSADDVCSKIEKAMLEYPGQSLELNLCPYEPFTHVTVSPYTGA